MANADLIQRVWETTAPALQESLLALGLTPHPLDLQTLDTILSACPSSGGNIDISMDPLLTEISERCIHSGGMPPGSILPQLERLRKCISIFLN